ncbi:MAG: heme a synthase [Frankiales bacterium]|jgi:cytochrome c oxidase assembly protein subunit 15|nr:heme a synthase [Frankiales bacterium]MDX6222332.1 heme a synthase [Frankiales bacterium]
MQRAALATLVANMALVATGGAVRLTDSGLGCPTWPNCLTGKAHAPTAYHHWIELGNRMLITVLVAIGVATLVVALRSLPRRRDLVRLSWLLLGAVPLQAVLGGITVLTHLNPWVVMIHFLASMVMVAAATLLLRRTGEGDLAAEPVTLPLLRRLVLGLSALVGVVLVLGTVVTGSGPHAGDATAKRNGLDPVLVTQLHADSVFLLVGLTVALVVAFAAVRAPAQVNLAVRRLLAVELAQGVVGYVQYFTKLPSGLVEVHLIGATATAAVTSWLVLSLRERGPQALPGPAPQPTATSAAPARAT